jgi:hypothetical protein
MVKFYEFHDTNRLMASWWKEDKKFTNQSNGWYGTINLREPYIYFMAHLPVIWRKIAPSYWVKHIPLGTLNGRIQEKWVNCERSWIKINRGMRDIGLP